MDEKQTTATNSDLDDSEEHIQSESPALDSLVYPENGGELVFAFVAPVGTDLKPIEDRLKFLLTGREYNHEPISLSSLIQETIFRCNTAGLSESDRINALQNAGNELRDKTANYALAAMACEKIYRLREEYELEERKETVETSETGYEPFPVRQAYILKSLKHPDEATYLRTIYGHGFYLIGVHAPWEDRKARLINHFKMSEEAALDIIQRDEKESDEHGQNTRDTFELADYFLRSDMDVSSEVERFLDLVFGDLFITPRRDEYGMNLAATSSYRSADLSRQVGACLLDNVGNVLGCGCNEVPKAFGGIFWDGDKADQRDFQRGEDPNHSKKTERFNKLESELVNQGITIDSKILNLALRNSGLRDITEFGRSVHAEMDAIMSCTRRGVSTKRATLYCTTFPCHNCARHIVATGIRRVVYIEPYPKSEAYSLHYDSILCPAIPKPSAATSHQGCHVKFEPFVGVAPRRMSDFFNLRHLTGKLLERKDGNGKPKQADPPGSQPPRMQLSPYNYLERENFAIKFVKDIVPIFEEEE